MGQSREGSRMLRLVLLFATLTCCLGAEFSTSESFVVKVGKTKKTATCDITISYEGMVVSEADSSVSCSVAWPKNNALNFAKTLSLTMGDVSADVFTADISMTLTKKSKKPASTLKTTIDSITVTGTVSPDPEFYPATLWCPAVDYFIWGQGAFDTSIVDESPATGFEECAQRCSGAWLAWRQLQTACLHERIRNCFPWCSVRFPQMLGCCSDPQPMKIEDNGNKKNNIYQ